MRFGLKVNAGTWSEAQHWAGIAEEVGFDGLWTGDNMRNPRDPAVPVHDGLTLIAAWAAITSRIRVGALIANAVFRRPTVLAKQVDPHAGPALPRARPRAGQPAAPPAGVRRDHAVVLGGRLRPNGGHRVRALR